MMKWGRLLSSVRLIHQKPKQGTGEPFTFYTEEADPYRSDHYRDGDRILFSSSFRRMHDKTQVYPLPENDHVHSRLTHSIEVASVGRSIGRYVGSEIKKKIQGKLDAEELNQENLDRLPDAISDTVYAACLAHDIGNPPFGHSGEKSIGSFFRNFFSVEKNIDIEEREREELKDFEGNAQGFRRITRIQNNNIGGLRLTAATIAAFCKYPRLAGEDISKKFPNNIATKKFGCFLDDQHQLALIAEKVDMIPMRSSVEDQTLKDSSGSPAQSRILCYARHPLAFLVEAADNISYLILDLEDGIRLGYVDHEVAIEKLCSMARVTYARGMLQRVPELRGRAINQLRNEVSQVFLHNYEAIMNGTYPKELTKDISSKDVLKSIEDFTRENCYQHKYVDEMALGGSTILHGLLEEFVSAVTGTSVMAKSKREMLLRLAGVNPDQPASTYQRVLMVTDYISGMTDGFAARLFRKIRGIDVSSDIR